MHRLFAPLIAAPIIFATIPAFAERDRSADRTINSVKPSGDPGSGGTCGVRLAAPAAAISGPSVSLTVDFARGSAQLTPQARETLDEFGAAVNSGELANCRFRIEGHTDTVGAPVYNKILSKRRAEAVGHYLIRQRGVRPERLDAVGMGEAGLLEPTPPQTPDARNRRVQVVNLGV